MSTTETPDAPLEDRTDLDSRAHLDSRYGRTTGRRRRTRLWAILVGSAVLVASVAWVIWVGIFSPASGLEVRDLGYAHDDTTATASWELTVDAGLTSSCAVQALNGTHAIVGWKIIEIPASDDRTRRFTETVRTSEPPVTGLIYRCWLT